MKFSAVSRSFALASMLALAPFGVSALHAQTTPDCPSHLGCTGKQCSPEQMEKAKGAFQGWRKMSPEEKIAAISQKMTAELGLTAEQQTKVNFIMNDTKAVLMEDWLAVSKPATAESRPAAFLKIKQDFEELNEKVDAILTEEQRTKFDSFVSQHKERMGHAIKKWKAGEPTKSESHQDIQK